jgi:predicted nucleic acid-binding protein
VKLDGKQLVLDTNILLYWLRGKAAGVKLKTDYDLGARRPRPIVPVVVKAEIKSLALQCEWGSAKLHALDALLRELPIADISSEAVIDAYARLDNESRKLGRRMGKNDLWIAALAAVLNAVVVTTDHDFDHLHPQYVAVERIDTATLGVAG